MPATSPHNLPSARRRATGFTLVELVVMIIVLAIAAAMILPQVTGMSEVAAQSAARRAVADLEYAQNHAVVSQASVSVTFNTAANSYRVHLSNESDPLIHPITKKAYEVDLDTEIGCEGVSLASVNFAGGSVVTFNALGAPDNAGTLDLTAGAQTYRVSVAAVTGRVSVAPVP